MHPATCWLSQMSEFQGHGLSPLLLKPAQGNKRVQTGKVVIVMDKKQALLFLSL